MSIGLASGTLYLEGCVSFVKSCGRPLPFPEFLLVGAQAWPSAPKSCLQGTYSPAQWLWQESEDLETFTVLLGAQNGQNHREL